MIRRPPRSTLSSSSAASDVYKRQDQRISILKPGNNQGIIKCDRKTKILRKLFNPQFFTENRRLLKFFIVENIKGGNKFIKRFIVFICKPGIVVSIRKNELSEVHTCQLWFWRIKFCSLQSGRKKGVVRF